MTANTPEAEPIYVAPYIGPVHTESSGKVELWPQQYKDALLSMHRKGWQARASLPSPPGALDADKLDAERYRWLRDRAPWTLISANGLTRLAARLPITMTADTGDAHEMDAAIDAAITAGQTPGGQKP